MQTSKGKDGDWPKVKVSVADTPTTPPSDQELLAAGGGSSPAAGVPFAAEIGAYFAAKGMTCDPMPHSLELGGEYPVEFRFETEIPVDDLVITTSIGGRIFFQKKTALGFGVTANSEMVKTVDQIVRLWKLCSTGDGSLGWNLLLNKNTDRVVIAVGIGSPVTVAQDLAKALKSRREGAASVTTPDDLEAPLTKFRNLLTNAWKSIYGIDSTSTEIDAILDVVVVASFAPADFEVGALTLAKNLADAHSAGASFTALGRVCEARMESRTGFNMEQVRRALEAKGVVMLAPEDFRQDQRILLEYSRAIAKRLARKSQLRVNNTQSIPIPRGISNVIVAAAAEGSLLTVGDPGVGKSGALSNAAAMLEATQSPVLTLKVEGPAAVDLRGQIGITHPIRTLLENWPGAGPAYLLIDGLDEARGGPAETTYRALIADVLELPDARWRVIASARTFDLRAGVQFRPLFRGSPPSPPDMETGEAFANVRHVVVRRWSAAEFEQVLQALPRLRRAIEVGGAKIRELAEVPFNTQLLADVAASGVEPEKIGSIRSQVQLLRLYWEHRVSSLGLEAEACLQLVVEAMVQNPFKNVLRAPILQARPAMLEKLLSQGVLVDFSDSKFLAFQHNILFDYAASRLNLDAGDEQQLKQVFARDRSLGLLLGPALSFSLKQLWEDDGTRSLFWKQVILLTADRDTDAIARCSASRAACGLVTSESDIQELVRQLQVHPNAKSVVDGLAGALSVLFEDAPELVMIAPWGYAVAEFSKDERLDGNTAALVGLLLKQDLDTKTFGFLGEASRRLLGRGLSDLSDRGYRLADYSIQLVARTFDTAPSPSKALLMHVFDAERLKHRAHVEVPTLAREISHIAPVDLQFGSYIYRRVFGHHEVSEQETDMSGNIFPMKSNAAQDYSMAGYSLAEYLTVFMEKDLEAATEAVIGVMEGDQ